MFNPFDANFDARENLILDLPSKSECERKGQVDLATLVTLMKVINTISVNFLGLNAKKLTKNWFCSLVSLQQTRLTFHGGQEQREGMRNAINENRCHVCKNSEAFLQC